MSELKACGMYIFGGSASIAHLQCGWNIEQVLEMTNDMPENNSYHFIKNYPEIPVLIPDKWNNDIYLKKLKIKNYDLLFANNPCSGLSYINRNPNVNQPINGRFFEVFNVIDNIEPKCFLIENAPSLVTIGTPILKEMVKLLHEKYNFTIIRDKAGNHNVPMNRMRTLIVGWNKNEFDNKIPLLHMNKQNNCMIKDVLYNINNLNNMEEVIDIQWDNLKSYYNYVKINSSVLRMCCENYNMIKDRITKSQNKAINTAMLKISENKNIWDKSPWRLDEATKCSSLTSISRFIHPTEHRNLYIREYARIMGYPDDFKFYPGECKCGVVQCIAQGVPVNFIKYISLEIKEAFSNNRELLNYDVIYQNHISKNYSCISSEEFYGIDNLHHYKSNKQLLTI